MYPERIDKTSGLLVYLLFGLLAGCRGGGGSNQIASEAMIRVVADDAEASATGMDSMPDMVYADIWNDATMSGRVPDRDLVLTYDGLPDGVLVPVDSIVFYPDHVQPLWDADRGDETCTSCHADSALDDSVSQGAGSERNAEK